MKFRQASQNKKSIGNTVVLYLALLIALTSGLASLLNYTYYTSRLVRDFEQQYRQDVDYLADLLTDPLWSYEFKNVESLCQAFLQTEGTLAISLESADHPGMFFGVDSSKRSDVKTLTREIEVDGTPLGRLEVQYTTAGIVSSARYSLLKFSLTILLVIATTAIAISWILKRLITQPFSLLQEKMLAISSGDFSLLQTEFQHRETQNIANAFNFMCRELLTREKEITQQSRFLRHIIEAMPSPLLILDKNLVITQFNGITRDFFSQLGLNIELRMRLGEIPLLENYRQQIEQVLSSSRTIQLNKERLSSLSGEHYVNILIFPIIYRETTHIAIRIDDITSLENQSNALLQAQKMEVVGTLAGGLAHDFNNVLGIISGSVSLLELKARSNMLEPEVVEKLVDRIRHANDRAIQMIQQLLMLAKQHHMDKKYVNLEAILGNCLKLGAASFDKSIRIDFHQEHQEKNCYGDAAKLEQVFLNLLINASHAMTLMRNTSENWGGLLSISIDKVAADKFFIREFPEARNDAYWQVVISDTGVGIPPKLLDKIFDPFFTTKENNKGTGLGLSMVKNIINNHEGFIKIYSEPGIGTTFNVYLPSVQQAADQPEPDRASDYRKLSGTLLLVDDETEIRRTGREMLEFLGVRVIEAENGLVAVDRYRQRQDEIDLILMDLVMPVRSGRDAAEEILAFDPQARIVMSSGFRKDFRINQALQNGALDFLHKPYSLNHLYQLLAKYLPTAEA